MPNPQEDHYTLVFAKLGPMSQSRAERMARDIRASFDDDRFYVKVVTAQTENSSHEATLVERDIARAERDRAQTSLRLILALADETQRGLDNIDTVKLAPPTRQQLLNALGSMSAEDARAALIARQLQGSRQ